MELVLLQLQVGGSIYAQGLLLRLVPLQLKITTWAAATVHGQWGRTNGQLISCSAHHGPLPLQVECRQQVHGVQGHQGTTDSPDDTHGHASLV